MAVLQYCNHIYRICSTYLLISGLLINLADCKRSPDCSTCKEIVDNFHKGLLATAKSNYGGGNTNWEEKSLGSYAFSEVRLVEIMENLCKDKSKECHTMLEEHEDLVESFWFKEFTKNTHKDFHMFLCIENVKACCPNNTFGKDCLPCPGGVDTTCHGNGRCDGEGTRGGTGKCRCNSGYTGDVCTECQDGHYQLDTDDSKTVCKVCHISCKGNCDGEGPAACDECKDGWLSDDTQGCIDVDECLTEPCDDNQYCANTQGSYSCFTCNAACTSCTGAGPDKCNDCSEGYVRLDNGKCEDKDECSLDSTLCSKQNEECINKPGGYDCICTTGYEYKDDECVKTPKEEEDDATEDIDEDIEDNDDDDDEDDTITKDKDEL